MSTIVPPTVAPVLPGTGNGGPATLAASGPPRVLDVLVDGALVDVVLVARPSKGVLQVMAAPGQLSLKLQSGAMPPLADGAALTLRVLGQGAEQQIRLVAVNGRPLPGGAMPGQPTPLPVGGSQMPQPGSTPSGTATSGMLPQAGTVPPTTPGNPPPPSGLTAIVIRPAQPPAAAGAVSPPSSPPASAQPITVPPDLPPGTRLTVRLVSIDPPVTQSPNPLPSKDGLPPAPLPGERAALPPLPPSPTASGGPSLAGTVLTRPPGGQAIVQTPIGTLSLPVDDRAIPGSRVQLQVVDQPQPPPPLAPPPRPQGLGNHGWPALTDSLHVLGSDAQGKDMEQFLRLMPQMGPRLLSGMSLFLDAAQRGDKRRSAIQALDRALEKKGRKDLGKQVAEDLEQISDAAQQPRGDGDWRLYTMPLLSQQVVDPIRLFVRGQGGRQGDQGQAATDQRFVLDFTLSRMGRLQLDGLVRRDDKQFDLIIRTQDPLEPATRHDILTIFTDAADTFGTKGTVTFQAGGQWIEPQPVESLSTQILA